MAWTVSLKESVIDDLRYFGRKQFRALFNVDRDKKEVIILAVGEKRGNSLLVQGKEFTSHHESDSAE